MAFRGKRSKAVPLNAADIANIAKSNPYIQAVLEDAKLRKNVSTAVNASKSAYDRVNNGKLHAQALLEDKKLHADMGRALGAARDATLVLTATKRRRRRGLTFGRVVVMAAVGGGIAIAASEQLRSKALDLLFGAEEEFQYTPPASPAPSSPTTTSNVGAA
jgi:hypothetical protein